MTLKSEIQDVQQQQQQQQRNATLGQLEQEKERQKVLKKKIVRRDMLFLIVGGIAASIMSWVEMNASRPEYRTLEGVVDDPIEYQVPSSGVVDTGYIVTTPIYEFLKDNRNWNDIFAAINTIIGVFGPGLYFVYETFWVGDYEPVFRYIAISILRSYCGWFTYLPPDNQYLMSNYDFPDIMQCTFVKTCPDPSTVNIADVNPFLSFFSGHVATLVIMANHMYLQKKTRSLAIFFHIFNVFQIVRLLATRGHYSIDIIIGFFMAVYVSNPAGRLGRYFSRGDESFFKHGLATNDLEVFEAMIGVNDVRNERRLSKLMKNEQVRQELIRIVQEEETGDGDDSTEFAEPAARMAYEGRLDDIVEDTKVEVKEKLDELYNDMTTSTKSNKEPESDTKAKKTQ